MDVIFHVRKNFGEEVRHLENFLWDESKWAFAPRSEVLYRTAESIRTTSSVCRWVSVFMNTRLR